MEAIPGLQKRLKLRALQVDVDGSGAVEWEEFCVLMHKKESNIFSGIGTTVEGKTWRENFFKFLHKFFSFHFVPLG